MKALIIFSILILGTLCTQRILREETWDKVKKQATWESYDYHENPFKDLTMEQLQSLFGTKLTWDEHNKHMILDLDDHSLDDKLPKEFDSRKQWSQCTFPVRSQEKCGSCW